GYRKFQTASLSTTQQNRHSEAGSVDVVFALDTVAGGTVHILFIHLRDFRRVEPNSFGDHFDHDGNGGGVARSQGTYRPYFSSGVVVTKCGSVGNVLDAR